MTNQITEKNINCEGHLTIGNCDTLTLVQEYQTPLVVYDVGQIRQQFANFKHVFEQYHFQYAISYASKAFANTAMYQLVNQMGGHIDVVSGGELAMALHAGFPASRISFHGNNKSREELRLALQYHIGVIMVDNFHEIKLLSQLLTELDFTTDVMLRITPGISAHTHEFIQTGQIDSKFGFDLASGQVQEAFHQVNANPRMNLLGFHAHIGSQIASVDGFIALATKMMELVARFQQEDGFTTQILDLGGGFGIRYTDEDDALSPQLFVQQIIETVMKKSNELNIPVPAIWIEPGRSLVGSAGTNLYTVGSTKRVPGLIPYVSVDGGMGDNIRPMLYSARYEAVLANDPRRTGDETVHLVGKYCESGDVLIKEAHLPHLQAGDIVAMLDTGAYGYSMASNYNLNLKPAVVFVENGKAQLVTRRQTYADLYTLDQNLTLKGVNNHD
jgi:diaminopimelate decarboxylase